MSRIISHIEGKYPVHDYNLLLEVSDNDCNILMLTSREIHVLLDLIGRDEVSYIEYQSRWYTEKYSSGYKIISDAEYEIIPTLAENIRSKLNMNCDINVTLKSIRDEIKRLADIKQRELISMADLVGEVGQLNDPTLSGALDIMLKMNEIIGLIPNIDVVIKPVDIIGMILQWRNTYVTQQANERKTKYMGIIASSLAGTDVLALVETLVKALPLADMIDQFSDLPEATVDVARILSALLTTSQLDLMRQLNENIEKCCESKEIQQPTLGVSYYPNIIYEYHRNFCDMLCTIVGRGVNLGELLAQNSENLYSIGGQGRFDTAIEVINKFYGRETDLGGDGMNALKSKMNVTSTAMRGFIEDWKVGLQSWMTVVNQSISIEQAMSYIQFNMPPAQAAYLDIFQVLMPPQDMVRVFSGTYDIDTVSVSLYKQYCNNISQPNNQAITLIDAFADIGNGNELRVGSVTPFGTSNIVQGEGYVFNGIYTKEVSLVSAHTVGASETLYLYFTTRNGTAIPTPPAVYQDIRVSIEIAGVGTTLGLHTIDQPQKTSTWNNIALGVYGTPVVKLYMDSTQFHYILDVTLIVETGE